MKRAADRMNNVRGCYHILAGTRMYQIIYPSFQITGVDLVGHAAAGPSGVAEFLVEFYPLSVSLLSTG
jgi:hypothetical protein